MFMSFVLMLLAFAVFIVIPGINKTNKENKSISDIVLNDDEKIIYTAVRTNLIARLFGLFLIAGIISSFFGVAAFSESGIETFYSDFSEYEILFLKYLLPTLGIILFTYAFGVYMPLDKKTYYDALIITNERIFYNKDTENFQLTEVPLEEIKMVYIKRNKNTFTRAISIETNNKIIEFVGFSDVDNLSGTLLSLINNK